MRRRFNHQDVISLQPYQPRYRRDQTSAADQAGNFHIEISNQRIELHNCLAVCRRSRQYPGLGQVVFHLEYVAVRAILVVS